MKKVCFIFVLMLLMGMCTAASGSDAYYINGHRVLLYKVINWWYDCLPGEASNLCGLPMTYRRSGNIRVQYNAAAKKIVFYADGGFASGIALFDKNKRNKEAGFITCKQLNEKQFGDMNPNVISGRFNPGKSLIIQGIDMETAASLKQSADQLEFEIKGYIKGLMDGRIALYPHGEFIKSCTTDSSHKKVTAPVILRLYNGQTGESVAVFHVDE